MIKISKLLQEVVYELISDGLPVCIKKTIMLENEALPMINHLIFVYTYKRKITVVALHEDQISNKLGELKTELGMLSGSYFMRQSK